MYSGSGGLYSLSYPSAVISRAIPFDLLDLETMLSFKALALLIGYISIPGAGGPTGCPPSFWIIARFVLYPSERSVFIQFFVCF